MESDSVITSIQIEGMKIDEESLRGMAKAAFEKAEAGDDKALTELFDAVYRHAYRCIAAEWFDLHAQAALQRQMEAQKASREAA